MAASCWYCASFSIVSALAFVTAACNSASFWTTMFCRSSPDLIGEERVCTMLLPVALQRRLACLNQLALFFDLSREPVRRLAGVPDLDFEVPLHVRPRERVCDLGRQHRIAGART